jgi:opacity protein-like surface antigen
MYARAGLLMLCGMFLFPSPASADVTAFLGTASTPSTRALKGFAAGFGVLVVGFEFEYASASEDAESSAPSLSTGMGNVLLQTPFAIARLQPYFTTGAGVYRERLGQRQETSVGVNVGGGVKISIAGPLRLRLDYRVVSLRGDPMHTRVHRVYAGANLRL